MEQLTSLIEKKNMPQLALIILFIIYLVLGFKMPEPLANVIDTLPGKIMVVLSALSLFAYANPILAVLGLVVAYQLIKSSATTTGTAAMDQFYPVNKEKFGAFTPTNQFPYTLEQEMVKKMAPTKFNTEYVKAPYRPLLEDTKDAAYLNSTV